MRFFLAMPVACSCITYVQLVLRTYCTENNIVDQQRKKNFEFLVERQYTITQ